MLALLMMLTMPLAQDATVAPAPQPNQTRVTLLSGDGCQRADGSCAQRSPYRLPLTPASSDDRVTRAMGESDRLQCGLSGAPVCPKDGTVILQSAPE